VSVIIPAYNVERYIKEALDSVFSQTYPHFEIIVVNDGTPDAPALEQVLQPYFDRIVYLKQENRGLSGARNTGLRAATGDLVALLDADDIWLPDYLEKQVAYLRENPDKDLVYCNAEFFGDGIAAGQLWMTVCPTVGEADTVGIITKRCNVFVAVTARTAALKAIGFDESLRSCEDYDCWLRFVAAGYRIGYQRNVLAKYRRHAQSLSSNQVRMSEYNIKVLTKALDLFPSESNETALILQTREKRLAERELLKGKAAVRDREFGLAIQHLEESNRYERSTKKSLLILALRIAPSVLWGLYRMRSGISSRYE
jgi:glycosyltransferase involved in cell wall biosynthesis